MPDIHTSYIIHLEKLSSTSNKQLGNGKTVNEKQKSFHKNTRKNYYSTYKIFNNESYS